MRVLPPRPSSCNRNDSSAVSPAVCRGYPTIRRPLMRMIFPSRSPAPFTLADQRNAQFASDPGFVEFFVGPRPTEISRALWSS